MNGKKRLFGKQSFPHILCFANDSVQINKTVYECGHSTLFSQSVRTAFESVRLSYKEHRADALALGAEEGRDKLRKAAGRSKYPMNRRYPNGGTHL